MSSVQKPLIPRTEANFDPQHHGGHSPGKETLSLVDETYLYRNLIFFSILLCILLALIIFCLVVTNWFQQVIGWPTRSDEEQKLESLRRRRVRRALTATIIEQWTDENGHFPNNVSCVICLEDFQRGELVRKLNCEHVFHVKCIDNWIMNMKAACPICKRGLVKRHSKVHDPESSAAESESDGPEIDMSSSVQMNPRGGASTPGLLFAVPSPRPQNGPIPPRQRDVLVEYFQTPEDAELNISGRREIVLEIPIVEVSPVPIVGSIPN